MAEYAPGRAGRHVTFKNMQICATDGRLDDFDDRIRRRGNGRFRPIFESFLSRSVIDKRLHISLHWRKLAPDKDARKARLSFERNQASLIKYSQCDRAVQSLKFEPRFLSHARCYGIRSAIGTRTLKGQSLPKRDVRVTSVRPSISDMILQRRERRKWARKRHPVARSRTARAYSNLAFGDGEVKPAQVKIKADQQ